MAIDPRQVTKSFTIMGSSFIPGAGILIDRLKPNQPLKLVREPTNPNDKNAVQVKWGERQLGWVPRQLAAELAPHMDAGVEVICRKAPPLPKFGAYRGILELAYIPSEAVNVPQADTKPEPKPAVSRPSEAADRASVTGRVSEVPPGEFDDDDRDYE